MVNRLLGYSPAGQARWGLKNLPPNRNRNRSTQKHEISRKPNKLNKPLPTPFVNRTVAHRRHWVHGTLPDKTRLFFTWGYATMLDDAE